MHFSYWTSYFFWGSTTEDLKQDSMMAANTNIGNSTVNSSGSIDASTISVTLAPETMSSSSSGVSSGIITSTPVGGQRSQSHRRKLQHEPSLEGITVEETEDSVVIDSAAPSAATSVAGDDVDVTDLYMKPGHVSVPIMGYEVMEERSRFTVFRIQVKQGYDDSWFIFRRYSDFDHLNQKLKLLFPHFRLALPPKKWFGDNFDRNFIEDRMLGLQAFLNNIIGHKEILNSDPVKEFFCFGDPPGPHDSLEESRALCEALEEQIFGLHQQLSQKDNTMERMEAEINLLKIQVDNLRKALRIECKLYSKVLPKSESIHGDHVLNLVLLDVMERAKSSAKRRPLLSTTVELPEEEETVAPSGGKSKKNDDDSPFLTPDNSATDESILTNSMAAMDTITMTTVQKKPELYVNNNKLSEKEAESARSRRSSPKTGPAQTRGSLEPVSQEHETVVASSSPTPKRANSGAHSSSNGNNGREHTSPGAHSVDVRVPRGRHLSDSTLPTLQEDILWSHDKDRGYHGDKTRPDASVRPKVRTKVLQRTQ